MINQELLGTFRWVVCKEEDIPEAYLLSRQEVDKYWGVFQKEHPNAVREPKIRINSLNFQKDKLVVSLSRGIDFADVVYTNWAYTSSGQPQIPQDTYVKFSNSLWKTDNRFCNAAAVGAIIIFKQENIQKTIFGIRSGKVIGSPNTMSFPVNGYVDPIEGVGMEDVLLENLYKEVGEEMFLSKSEIGEPFFVGPAQMRGKSCDFIWVLRPKISYDEWFLRWRNRLNEEFTGIVSYDLFQIRDLFSGNISEFSKKTFVSDNSLKLAGEVKLNPLLGALKNYLLELAL